MVRDLPKKPGLEVELDMDEVERALAVPAARPGRTRRCDCDAVLIPSCSSASLRDNCMVRGWFKTQSPPVEGTVLGKQEQEVKCRSSPVAGATGV